MLRAKYYFCYALICNSLELTEGVLSFCLDCIIKGIYNNNDLVKIFQNPKLFFFLENMTLGTQITATNILKRQIFFSVIISMYCCHA